MSRDPFADGDWTRNPDPYIPIPRQQAIIGGGLRAFIVAAGPHITDIATVRFTVHAADIYEAVQRAQRRCPRGHQVKSVRSAERKAI